MAEYIEREALMEQLAKKKAGIADKRYTEGFNDALMRFRSMVHSAKAADVVAVVRCKDCQYYDTACCVEGLGWCDFIDSGTADENFCSYGERRGESE